MSQLQNAFTLFLSLLVEAMPFLLLGVILSSILLIFVDERRLVALMPRNAVLGAFVGGCIGFLFPVCECGNVPVARRLLVQGMPNAVAVSFLLAAPTINPIVIWSTWVAFRDQPEIVFYRVIFSLFIATVIGIIFSIQKDPRPLLQTSLAKSLNWQPQTPEKESIPLLLQSGSFLIGNFCRYCCPTSSASYPDEKALVNFCGKRGDGITGIRRSVNLRKCYSGRFTGVCSPGICS